MKDILINAMTYNLLNIKDMMKSKGIIEINDSGVYMETDRFLETFEYYNIGKSSKEGVYRLSKKVASLNYYTRAKEEDICT